MILAGCGLVSEPITIEPPTTSPPQEPQADEGGIAAGNDADSDNSTITLDFRQVTGRDSIRPIYSPEFTAADEADWDDDTLVIGVAGATQAKAYPVSVLNRREMVNDEIDAEPILVSW